MHFTLLTIYFVFTIVCTTVQVYVSNEIFKFIGLLYFSLHASASAASGAADAEYAVAAEAAAAVEAVGDFAAVETAVETAAAAVAAAEAALQYLQGAGDSNPRFCGRRQVG